MKPVSDAPSALSQACEDRDFVDWHQGLPWCAVWVVLVPAPDVAQRVAVARAALNGSLLPRYARQPHITLAYRGLMDVPAGHAAAQFDVDDLQADIARLQASALAPFTVQIAGSDSFTTVPYLPVQSASPLHALHDALALAAPYPGWQYVPHITVGHYADAQRLDGLRQRMASAVNHLPALQVPVTAVHLVRYRTHDIAGALYVEGVFDLPTRRYYCASDALWPRVAQ